MTSKPKKPELPLSLQQALTEDNDSRFKFRFNSNILKRKQARKDKRQQKKQRKEKPKEEKKVVEKPVAKIVKKAAKKPVKESLESEKERQKRQFKKMAETNPALFNHLQKQGLVPLTVDANVEKDDDDADIYAKKLKLKEGKINQSFKKDGLDFLLDFGEDEDAKQWQSLKRDHPSDQSDSEDAELEDDDEELENNSGLEMSEDDELEMPEEESDQEMPETDEPELTETDEKEKETVEKQTKAYVPPHLREKPKDESYARLKRQIQGQLNRLTDANLDSIVQALEDLYRQHPRHDVSEITTDLLLTYVSDHQNLLDSFVATYAGFVAAMYHVVGVEFAASFIQTMVTKLLEHRSASLNAENESGKKAINLSSLLAHLYAFKAISHILMYDMIRLVCQDLNEVNVEILLKLLRIAGPQLRSDDPTSLKDIILLVQSNMDQQPTSLRLKFMLETVMDLKNNKSKKQPNSQMDLLKKAIQAVTKRRSLYEKEALGCSLDDIQSSDTKGKWWLVGAAWVGHDPIKSEKQDSGLLELARKQKMNTDIRKSIFVIVMSSEDCIDCYNRLLKLSLKNKQEREIIRVLVHCCQQEKVYNPYYRLVLQQFLERDYAYMITMQYCLWDSFKLMQEQEKTQDNLLRTSHLAKMAGDLVKAKCLQLSFLKVD
ncbi:armadillo-type protein [Gorgonomyces haynaldii]|nr:armadillo-type protein [Gorgonomyces haynaldii]